MELVWKIFDEMKVRASDRSSRDELAKAFIIKNCYRTDQPYGSLRVVPIMGWVVLKISQMRHTNPETEFFAEDEKELAIDAAKQYYHGKCDDEWLKNVCYKGIVGFEKMTGARAPFALLNDDDNINLDQIIERNLERVSESIKIFINNCENSSYLQYFTRYDSSDAAKEDYNTIAMKNHDRRGKDLASLRKINEFGVWYVRDEDKWKEDEWSAKKKPKMPEICEPISSVSNVPYTSMGFLMQWDDFLFGDENITIAEALVVAHKEIKNDENAVREALNGHDNKITEDSNFKETILSMAKNGFDLQPIIDDKGEIIDSKGKKLPHVQCIGAVRLQDVLRVISRTGADTLPSNFEIEKLQQQKLWLPSPPLLDARGQLSDAENVLKSGSDGILIWFNPDTWWDKGSSDVVEKGLKPGLHIMTSHDIAAYHLSRGI